jgi:hypothetical protein
VKAQSVAKSKLAIQQRNSRYHPSTKQELIQFYGMHMLIEETYSNFIDIIKIERQEKREKRERGEMR